ncbi:MAG: aminofutalosine synthase MqnE [Planctomycetes bacterium]|nr:aminofutalosine synthase MqnE [Planctomycetota bacterium]
MAASAVQASDPAIKPICAKVLASERLSRADARALYHTRDIFTLGELANQARTSRHGRKAFYNINRHINYTNFCVLRCKFCSFYRPYPRRAERAADGYELALDEIVQTAADACKQGATEVHIVGGLHPKLPFSYYTDMCRAIKQSCPKLHIKAFTAIEIVHFTRISKPRLSIAEVLLALCEAGLDSLPGGGAEIFDDRVHDETFQSKVGEQHWFDVHRVAHELGIPSNATMLYGHIETADERITHLIKLREHQDDSLAQRKAAFQCCVPLAFIPEGSALAHLPGPTGIDDLRTLAVTRLMLDNFPHIKAFWPMLSPKLSQVALNWGIDDFDGTVVYYDITKREGRGTNRQELSVDQIRNLIREAGCIPVERDTLYREVRRDRGAEPCAASPAC